MTNGDRAADFRRALERYLPDEAIKQDKERSSAKAIPQESREKMPIQDSIDLHGLNLEQAREQVDRFLKNCVGRGLGKVLIIHGKGTGILQNGIARYLEGHPLAGRRHAAKAEDGGSGALVVYIRQK